MLESAFSFQAGARPIEQQRPKYRNDRSPDGPCMITVDPRVCRGSTFRRKLPGYEQPQPQQTSQQRSARQRLRARNVSPTAKHGYEPLTSGMNPFDFPQQKENRIDLWVQTEPYLQEVEEEPVNVECDTQTDAFLDRPPTPPYIPPKNGVDVEVQTEEDELFDFDFEVQPITATIVGKILEQAFMEVNEEEELANIKRHREAIEHQRNVELADVQRLEEAERRKFEEKQRRLEERLRVEMEQAELREKIAARGFGEFFVSDLMGDAISLLERRGYFYDEVEREIETVFMPWLEKAMNEASQTHELNESIEHRLYEKAIEIDEDKKNQFVIDTGVQTDQRKIRQQNMFRRLLIEDIASRKIRDALLAVKKKNQEQRKEEEDESEA